MARTGTARLLSIALACGLGLTGCETGMSNPPAPSGGTESPVATPPPTAATKKLTPSKKPELQGGGVPKMDPNL